MEAKILFQMGEDWFNDIFPYETFPLPGRHAPFPATGPMNFRNKDQDEYEINRTGQLWLFLTSRFHQFS